MLFCAKVNCSNTFLTIQLEIYFSCACYVFSNWNSAEPPNQMYHHHRCLSSHMIFDTPVSAPVFELPSQLSDSSSGFHYTAVLDCLSWNGFVQSLRCSTCYSICFVWKAYFAAFLLVFWLWLLGSVREREQCLRLFH